MKRSPLPPRRTPIRSRSRKVSSVYARERRPLVASFLSERPICERCKSRPSTDVHELKSRARGGSITDPANLAALCRPCHTWVTTNPADAHAEGWLLNSWE